MSETGTKEPLDQSPSAGSEWARRSTLSLITLCLDSDTTDLLNRFVASISFVRLRARLEDYRTEGHDVFLDWMGDPPPDICLIDFDKNRRHAVMVAEKIHADFPETAVFAVSSQAQPDLIIQAMRSGCGEYLVKPVDREQLLSALARVGVRKRDRREQYNAQVLTFIGAKGGCGVTTLITQLGALLAHSYERKTLLMDLHPDFGDAALYLGLTKYRYHSFELIENTERLDAELLQSFVFHHTSGLDLIPAPEGSEAAPDVLPGAVIQTLDFLRSRYEFILVDLPSKLTDREHELIRHSDQVFVITVAEVSALRNTARLLEYLSRKAMLQQDQIRVVLNRHHKNSLITDGQIEKVMGRKVFWKVPNQYAHVVKTINQGDPVAQLASSEVMRNLKELAGAIGRKPSPEEKKKQGHSILGLWNR